MVSIRASLAVLALGLTLLPALSVADPRDEAPAGEQLDPDYAVGKAAITAKNWEAAIRSLSSAALRDTRNADIQNYLGYAYRQTGQLELAPSSITGVRSSSTRGTEAPTSTPGRPI